MALGVSFDASVGVDWEKLELPQIAPAFWCELSQWDNIDIMNFQSI